MMLPLGADTAGLLLLGGGGGGGGAVPMSSGGRSERVVVVGSTPESGGGKLRGQIARTQSSAAILGYRGGGGVSGALDGQDLDVSLRLFSQINIHDSAIPVAMGVRSPIIGSGAGLAPGGNASGASVPAAALDMPRRIVRDRPMSATGKSRVSSARALRPQPVKVEGRVRNKSATMSRRIGGGGTGGGAPALPVDNNKEDKDLRLWMRNPGRGDEEDGDMRERPPSRQSNAFPMRLADPTPGGDKIPNTVLGGGNKQSALTKSKHNRPTSRKKAAASSLFLSDNTSSSSSSKGGGAVAPPPGGGGRADEYDIVDDDLIVTYDESGYVSQQKEARGMMMPVSKQQRQTTGWGGESGVATKQSSGWGGESVVVVATTKQSSPSRESPLKGQQGVIVASSRESPLDHLTAFDESDDDVEYFVSQPQRARAKDERRDNPDRDGFSDLAESGLWTIKIEVTNSTQQANMVNEGQGKGYVLDKNNSSDDESQQEHQYIAKPPPSMSSSEQMQGGGFGGLRNVRTIRTAPHNSGSSSAFLPSQIAVQPTPPETIRPDTVGGTTPQFLKGSDVRKSPEHSFVVAGDYIDAHTNGAFMPVSGGKKTVWTDDNEDDDILLTSFNGDDGDLFGLDDDNNEVARSASVAALETNLGSDFLSLFAPSPPPMGRAGAI